MKPLLRGTRLLAYGIWLGSLIFFAFVLAPIAFSSAVVDQTHSLTVSGLIVGTSLRMLHWIGLACGIVFFLCVTQMRRRHRNAERIVIAIMLAITAASQFIIIPRMERDRVQAGGDIATASIDNPARQDFELLHPISEKMEGIVLLGALTLTGFMADEADRTHTID